MYYRACHVTWPQVIKTQISSVQPGNTMPWALDLWNLEMFDILQTVDQAEQSYRINMIVCMCAAINHSEAFYLPGNLR